MPACAEVNATMQQLTGVVYETNEQHKEAKSARIEKYWKYSMSTLYMYFLEKINPFETNVDVLKNIDSGVASDSHVNIAAAERIGRHILDDMCGKVVDEYSFKRKTQVIQMKKTLIVTE